MKNINIYAVALAMSLAACSNEEFKEVGQEGGIKTVSAEIVQPSSRTIIGDLTDNHYPLTWEDGDYFTAFAPAASDGYRESRKYFYVGTQNGSRGLFTSGEGFPGLSKMDIAFANIEEMWGADATFGFNKEYSSDFPTTNPSFGSEKIPMYGVFTDGEFKFHQLCGMLKLNLKGEFKVGDRLVVSSDGTHPIAGFDAKVSVPEGTPQDAKIVLDEYADMETILPFTVSADGKSAQVYVKLPVAEYDSLSFKIRRVKEVAGLELNSESNTVTVKTKTVGGKLVIGKNIYPYDLEFTSLAEPTPLKASFSTAADQFMMEWKEGDKFYAFKSAKNFGFDSRIEFSADLSDGTASTADFYSEKEFTTTDIPYAIYPAGYSVKQGDEGYLNIALSNNMNITESLGSVYYLGKYDEASQSMKFEQTMGVVEVTLPADWWKYTDEKGNEANVKALLIKANRAIVPAKGKNAKLNLADATMVVESGENQLILKQPWAVFKGTTIRFGLPAGTDYTSISFVTAKQGATYFDYADIATLGTFTPEAGTIEKKLYKVDLTK